MTTSELDVDKNIEQAEAGGSAVLEVPDSPGVAEEQPRTEGEMPSTSADADKRDSSTDEDGEDGEGGSSRLSNIIAVVFVGGLIAFNVYAFWGYNDYGRPEVSPDRPVSAQVDGSAPAGTSVGVTAVPGVSAANDELGASGLSDVRPGAHPPAPSGASGNATAPSGASSNAVAPSGASGNAVAPSGASGTATAPSGASGNATAPSGASSNALALNGSAGSALAPNGASGRAPTPFGASRPTPPAPTIPVPPAPPKPKKSSAAVPPPPGKRPAPVFSKHNTPGNVDVVEMPEPQFLLGVGALCNEPKVGLSKDQRAKIGALVTKLIADQNALTQAGEESLCYLTREQVDWILNNPGNIDISNVEPEAGYDPFTTATMRLLRSKKQVDGKPLKRSKYINTELTFQDIASGLLRLEANNPSCGVSTEQAKALLPIVVKANQARKSEAMHYQQLREVLSKQQQAWLHEHPEKSMMNINSVVLNYVRLAVK